MDPLATARRLVFPFLAALILLGLVLITFTQCSKARQAGTEAAVATSQAAATGESGADAVRTLGEAQAASDAIDQTHRENAHAIQSAPGADAPVDPALARTARRGLCRYAANRSKPECMQQPVAP